MNKKRNSSDFEFEIDLAKILRILLEEKKIILISSLVGLFVGIILAITSTKIYKSKAELLPEYSVNNLSETGSLLQDYGSLIGLNTTTYANNNSAYRVELYPNIVNSIKFQLDLINEPFYFSNIDTNLTIFEYYNLSENNDIFDHIKSSIINIPKKIVELFVINDIDTSIQTRSNSFSSVLNLTIDELQIMDAMRDNITTELDEDTGIITLSVIFEDRIASANIADYAINQLTEYLTDYNTKKILLDLNFIKNQLDTSRTRFEYSVLALAEFRERNKGDLSPSAQIELQALNSEYQLGFNLYNNLSQNYEETKIKLQETTPFFELLEPVTIPIFDEVSGFRIVFKYVFIAIVFSFIFIFVKAYLEYIGNKNSDINFS